MLAAEGVVASSCRHAGVRGEPVLDVGNRVGDVAEGRHGRDNYGAVGVSWLALYMDWVALSMQEYDW